MVKAIVAIVVVLVLGMVGFVVQHERSKVRPPKAAARGEAQEVATISHGERVDLDAYIPRQDLTVVEFTAGF